MPWTLLLYSSRTIVILVGVCELLWVFPFRVFHVYILCLRVFIFYSCISVQVSLIGCGQVYSQQSGIKAKVHKLQAKENRRFILWNVQANQLQLVCVEIEDERHARMPRTMAMLSLCGLLAD